MTLKVIAAYNIIGGAPSLSPYCIHVLYVMTEVPQTCLIILVCMLW